MSESREPDIGLATPTQVKNFLRESGLSARKFLGQHFLVDKNILNKIIQTAEIKKGEKVLEIGAGIGTLTFALAGEGAYVVAIEKDKNLASILEELTSSRTNIKIINDDILKIDLETVLKESSIWKVISNPPYNITALLLFKLIFFRKKFSSIILMLQREFAERLTAQPGSKDYSFLTIKTQYYMEIDIIHKVSRNVFFPTPRVDSTLLVLKPLKNAKIKVSNEELFFKIADAMFRMRRKNLKNSLKPLNLPLTLYKKSPIDLTRRGETLSLEELGVLTDFISNHKNQNERETLGNKTT
jgi:16S rRNA (adenine1518-N6/adenine1519-N6)-dimethyltransferase